MRQALVLASFLLLAACAGEPKAAPMTHGTVPRDGRGEPVLAAVPPPPPPPTPPPTPPPADFKPAAQPPVSCQHLRHC